MLPDYQKKVKNMYTYWPKVRASSRIGESKKKKNKINISKKTKLLTKVFGRGQQTASNGPKAALKTKILGPRGTF